MDATRIQVIKLKQGSGLARKLMEDEETQEEYAELCGGHFSGYDIGRVMSDGGIHYVIHVFEGKTLKSFGLVSVPLGAMGEVAEMMKKLGLVPNNPPYAEISLLCGGYRTKDGRKGSDIILEETIKLAKTFGKKTICVDPADSSRDALIEKVYGPMGFKPIKGSTYLELPVPESGASRFKKQTRRAKRHGRSRKHPKLHKLTTRRR